jgi:serine phosphatase RsbU (regulator of sigma subunit)
MTLSLRKKIMSLLVLVSGLLLCLALGTIWSMGYGQRLQEEGTAHAREAGHAADRFRQMVGSGVNRLNDLLLLSNAGGYLAGAPAGPADLEARWAELSPADPALRSLLENPLALTLRRYHAANPLVAELLVADRSGHLVAASQKTSDYDQSDETWWREGMTLQPGEAFLDGLEMDESSGVFALNLALPVFAGTDRPVGVLKAVLNISPLLAQGTAPPLEAKTHSEVVAHDGRVLLRLGDATFRPTAARVPERLRQTLDRRRAGWELGEAELAGFAPLSFLGVRKATGEVRGEPAFVVVRQPAASVTAPLVQRTLVLMVLGTGIIAVSCAVAMFLVGRNFLRPLEALERAAAALAGLAGGDRSPVRRAEAENALSGVAGITTGDEIEVFARDFDTMARRLIRYQDDLKREIAEKTAEIQSDLDMAREFQQAFLPRTYPQIPAASGRDPLTLHFQHVFQAATAVSGDFFDVLKLGDSRAGILIADVMGHGTRSALVTAILRTLIHGLARAGDDPAEFLELLNHHFHTTMRQADQVIFVSACFLVLDTGEKSLRGASAGHPSPLLGNRVTGTVEPLYHALKDNPALGLFPAATYREFARPLREEDVLILYTDGMTEALSEGGEEFGRLRLEAALRQHLDEDIAALTQSLLTGVLQFTGYQPPADDLCLVAVEAVSNCGPGRALTRRSGLGDLVEL